MPFPNPDTQFQPGKSGNPAGPPKGHKKLSTWIQELANDESFEANILDAKKGLIGYKGAPIKAIISVAVAKAVNGDDKAREWLGKYYGDAQKYEHSGNIGVQEVRELTDDELNQRIATTITASQAGSTTILSRARPSKSTD